jgi:peptidoglycan/LPS O-acetylase OafA/YrhL
VAKSVTKQKNLALEGLRGVASLNVVLGHFLFSFFPYLAHDVRPYPGAVAKYWFEEVLRYFPFTFAYLADSAVSVFFVLSGYVLTRRFYQTGRPDVFEGAAAKRYIRLVVPAAVSALLAWVLLQTGAYANGLAPTLGTAGWVMSFYTEPVSFGTAFLGGVIGAPLFGQSGLNGPLWTIQIELVGSILLFGCYALFGNRSRILLILWFSYFAYILGGRGPVMLNYLALLIGSFIHLAETRLRVWNWLSRACLALGLLGVSFTHARPYAIIDKMPLPNLTPYGPNFDTDHILFWHTAGAALLLAGVIGSTTASRLLNHRFLVYLGRLSFAIYLLHFPLLMSLSFRIAQLGHSIGMSYWAYAGCALLGLLAALFPLAEVFYRFVDAPSMLFADRISKRLGRASVVPRAVPAPATQPVVSPSRRDGGN